MDRPGLHSRLLLNTCGCVCVAIMVVGGAFSVTMALVPDESATASGFQMSGQKIGPGYAHMPPIDRGKPDGLPTSIPHYPHVVTPNVATMTRQVAPAIVAELPVTNVAVPIRIATVIQSSYRVPDIHRIY